MKGTLKIIVAKMEKCGLYRCLKRWIEWAQSLGPFAGEGERGEGWESPGFSGYTVSATALGLKVGRFTSDGQKTQYILTYFDSGMQTACSGVESKLTCLSCPSSIPTLQTSDVLLKQQPLFCTNLLPNILKKTISTYDFFYCLEFWAIALQNLLGEHFRQHCSSGG